ncbi:MAG: MFS transporter [Planctomycetes bacterium]|nr:MFS transporter [Planctomycetota bacterium]
MTIAAPPAAPSASAPASPIDRHADYDRRKLFIISVIALATAGMSFILRSSIAGDLQTTFLDPIDQVHSAQMLGGILGVAFLGFAFTIAIGSPLLDVLGMGRLLMLSSLCFIVGTLTIIFASALQGAMRVDSVLWCGSLATGIGWGLVETVINPLTATLYPEDKTSRLNVLHAWWPGGLIIGGLVGLAIGHAGFDWRIRIAAVIIPAVVFGAMIIGTRFPPTERVAHGVSTREMFKEVGRPMFIIWFGAMFLTAASELAPGQWVEMALTRTVGMHGIWLLVYVSGIMFVMRHFAGSMAHKLSPVGLLWVSCLLASAGLLALSVANSPVTGILAATLWGTGVCYMWPTMLASASERFPRGGALLMGLMGTAGTLSIYFVLPRMGMIFDEAKITAAGGTEKFQALSGEPLNQVLIVASQTSFRAVAILPALLLVVFGAIWLYDRSRGGYRPEKI